VRQTEIEERKDVEPDEITYITIYFRRERDTSPKYEAAFIEQLELDICVFRDELAGNAAENALGRVSDIETQFCSHGQVE
jgi:hypothetical protein